MAVRDFTILFSDNVLTEIFPTSRADDFFDALFGDPAEGSFDIELRFNSFNPIRNELLFDIQLIERPGKCLACNLTYGLPDVFSRHPVINIQGVVDDVESRLDGLAKCKGWALGHTSPQSKKTHVIPLVISLE